MSSSLSRLWRCRCRPPEGTPRRSEDADADAAAAAAAAASALAFVCAATMRNAKCRCSAARSDFGVRRLNVTKTLPKRNAPPPPPPALTRLYAAAGSEQADGYRRLRKLPPDARHLALNIHSLRCARRAKIVGEMSKKKKKNALRVQKSQKDEEDKREWGQLC